MTHFEQPVAIHGPGFAMLGVVSAPTERPVAQSIGMVIVAGGAQSRAGSHRQNVSLARRLACSGFPALRFDLPGLGDSPGEPVAFENSAAYLRRAIDTMIDQNPGLKGVCLWGLCDAASASLLYLSAAPDPRVLGVALLNPWVRSDASLARTRIKYYYPKRLMSQDFWKKLLRGKVRLTRLREWWRNFRQALSRAKDTTKFQDQMARAWSKFPGHILLMLSERDLTAQEFSEYVASDPQWMHWEQHPHLQQLRLANADHTCSSREATGAMETATCTWMTSIGT